MKHKKQIGQALIESETARVKSKMKILILTITIFIILSSGCLGTTINADKYSKNVIQHTLELSEKDITKYINSITVYYDEDELNEKCKLIDSMNPSFNRTPIDQYVGCVELEYVSDSENADLGSADMHILSDIVSKDFCESEGNTVAYLIGTMEYNIKYNSKTNDEYVERLYAEEYANQRIKNKCESDEYKNLENELQAIQDNYNNSVESNEHAYMLASDRYNSKWGRYTSIPENRYSEYSRDYDLHQEAYQKYSNTDDNLYSEYEANYDKILEDMNKSMINYQYPFMSKLR